MDLTAIVTWIIFGAIVGVIARFLMPGRDPAGFVVTVPALGGWRVRKIAARFERVLGMPLTVRASAT